ncbi:DNA polymerase III subunit beta [Wolbachia pipientis]|uniref:Beta sliding clamp n=1 Tax=Wolbachia pipientis TaxID=955 RepID=A0A1E7QLD2_WOLPI|nr:DNA polymerase III subunit beta [Wolbachia pipientis]OEY87024.1 DNA polymerase III subunit beta [Wolbachia pipientis]
MPDVKQLHFSISRTDLLNILSKVSGVVESRNAIAILACVNIRAEHGKIKFMATARDISIFASLVVNVFTEGEVRIAAHTLHDIVRKLPPDLDVTFKVDKKEKLLISCGNANFSLPNVTSSRFPTVEDDTYKHEFTLSSNDLADSLTKTKFSISIDDTRYNLNGIYLHADEQFLYFVTTDCHRLSCVNVPKPVRVNGKLNVIIPRKTVTELLKMLDGDDKINIELSERKIKFTCGNYILISKLIDGIFPDYKAYIPVFQDKCVVIESKKLSDVIDRVSVIISDKIKSIKLSLQKDKLILSSNCQESSNAVEHIDVDYNNTSIEIGFNARYLLDALSCIKNKCRLHFIDSYSAMKITDENNVNILLIVMPMRTMDSHVKALKSEV